MSIADNIKVPEKQTFLDIVFDEFRTKNCFEIKGAFGNDEIGSDEHQDLFLNKIDGSSYDPERSVWVIQAEDDSVYKMFLDFEHKVIETVDSYEDIIDIDDGYISVQFIPVIDNKEDRLLSNQEMKELFISFINEVSPLADKYKEFTLVTEEEADSYVSFLKNPIKSFLAEKKDENISEKESSQVLLEEALEKRMSSPLLDFYKKGQEGYVTLGKDYDSTPTLFLNKDKVFEPITKNTSLFDGYTPLDKKEKLTNNDVVFPSEYPSSLYRKPHREESNITFYRIGDKLREEIEVLNAQTSYKGNFTLSAGKKDALANIEMVDSPNLIVNDRDYFLRSFADNENIFVISIDEEETKKLDFFVEGLYFADNRCAGVIYRENEENAIIDFAFETPLSRFDDFPYSEGFLTCCIDEGESSISHQEQKEMIELFIAIKSDEIKKNGSMCLSTYETAEHWKAVSASGERPLTPKGNISDVLDVIYKMDAKVEALCEWNKTGEGFTQERGGHTSMCSNGNEIYFFTKDELFIKADENFDFNKIEHSFKLDTLTKENKGKLPEGILPEGLSEDKIRMIRKSSASLVLADQIKEVSDVAKKDLAVLKENIGNAQVKNTSRKVNSPK